MLEPSEVEKKRRSRSGRQPELTEAELRELAEQAGVGVLYEHAVGAFEGALQKKTTRSSIGFTGRFARSRRTVISFVPGESDADSGLRYQLHSERLGELADLSAAEVTGLLPPDHEPADLLGGSAGVEGFLKTLEEVDKIAGALSMVAVAS